MACWSITWASPALALSSVLPRALAVQIQEEGTAVSTRVEVLGPTSNVSTALVTTSLKHLLAISNSDCAAFFVLSSSHGLFAQRVVTH